MQKANLNIKASKGDVVMATWLTFWIWDPFLYLEQTKPSTSTSS